MAKAEKGKCAGFLPGPRGWKFYIQAKPAILAGFKDFAPYFQFLCQSFGMSSIFLLPFQVFIAGV